ncbi:MAG: S8 family serine peptidase [Nonlabens sp.]|uniref:S8 family serine peptidase n=1 Tax=Nonlabens sp. TaxID=1888209 RepID=UPI00321B8F92
MKTKITLLTILLCSFFASSQNAKERADIIKFNNQAELQKLIVEFNSKYAKDQDNVLKYSRINNVPVFLKNENGSFDQLMRITDDGMPVYFSVDNVDSANSTRANRLHNGGSLGLNIEGQGMTAYVWDGGPTRVNHNEFVQAGVGRAIVGDGASALNGNSFHATHVSGTIAASGFNPDAKGMAPKAEVLTNTWDNDSAEMASAAANGALISNHSYGIRLSSVAGFPGFAGKYTDGAREVDQIAFNAPYFLPVYSAGNDGQDNTSNGSPVGGSPGFDKLTGDKVAKNTMVVANAQDASINTDGSLNSVAINSGSSQGPTDDLRIKPDITGNGTQVFSTFDSSESAYGTISGTSMSSPNVAGSLLLLQQYYNQKNGVFMRSATLKGLALHTADDVGSNGPDPVWGWGLMNTMKAAQTITDNRLKTRIVELDLNDGGSYTIDVEANALEDLVASISWTDVPGQVNNNAANDPTPALVNDLDIRITQNGTTFEPWRLGSNFTAATGDNTVDNYERIDIPAASGTYTITVTHKGSLFGGSQKFSLIVTGEDNNFAINSTINTLEVCNDQTGVMPIDFVSKSNFNDPVTLSIANLPAAITAVFGSSTFTASGNTTLNFSNLNAVNDGVYPISIIASSSSETKTIELFLRVMSDNFSTINTIFPTDQLSGVNTSAVLRWQPDLNAQTYKVEIATNPMFGRPFVSEFINTSVYAVDPSILMANTTYYWRVQPINDCGIGVFKENSFTTFQCNEINASLPSPISLPDNNTTGIQSSIAVNEANNIVIGKVTVQVSSIHEYSGDLNITLTSPSGTVVALTSPNGCATANLDVVFNDDGGDFVCNTTVGQPGYTGVIAPVGDLSNFNGETINGTWTLNVSDRGPADLGTLNNWKINFCEVPAVLSNEIIEDLDFAIYPNPSNGLFTVSSSNDLDGDATINVVDLNGRVVFTKDIQNASRLNETIDVQNLTSGLYLLQIQSGTSRTVKKIIIQ